MGVGLLNSYIGKYRIKKEIARGGMGAVFLAIHPTLKKTVILKKLTLKGKKDITERFKREARIMMEFKYEGIVDVYDHFIEGSNHYIVLEYIDGISLKELLEQQGPLSETMALYLVREVASSLAYAHEKKVIHRDIKPGNILLSRNGDVKLVDFGIATTTEAEKDASLTRDGVTLGTPSYMPPEQFSSTKGVDHRVDIYALGVVLYEMLTGQKPFPGEFSTELIQTIQRGRCVSPRKLAGDLGGRTTRLIRKMMRPKPRRRIKTAAALLDRLDRKMPPRIQVECRRELAARIAGKEFVPSRRRRRLTPRRIFLFMLILLALGGGGFLYQSGYYRELFQRSSFGVVRFQIQVEHQQDKTPREVFLQGWIFREAENYLSAADLPRLDFSYKEALSDEDTYVYETGKIYLPTGNYRLKLSLENNLIWDILFVDSIRSVNTADPDAVTQWFHYGPPDQHLLPLDLEVSATDKITGEDLTDRTFLSIEQEGAWIPLGMSDALTTGMRYQLAAEAPGYYPEYYTVTIRPFQSITRLNLRMMPLPATVHIEKEGAVPDLLVDGKRYYLEGAEDMGYREVPREENFDLLLIPGKHILSFDIGGTPSEKEINISSGEEYFLYCKEDEDGNPQWGND